jgi:hypothetical protein
MPKECHSWTDAQVRSRSFNMKLRRQFHLAKKRRMELATVASMVSQRLAGILKDEPEMDDKTGFCYRDATYSTGSVYIVLRRQDNTSSGQVPRKRYRQAIRNIGWRAARELAFTTDYFQFPWPSPQTEEELSITVSEDFDGLSRYL